MPLRLTTRPALVVGCALAATLAAGPAFAASTPTRTSLSISTSSTGFSNTAQPITGTLKAGTTGLAYKTVRLVGRVNGSTKYQDLRYGTTNKDGIVTFSIKPPKGHDQYALVFNGSRKTSPAYAGSHSRTVTVTVSK